RAGAESPKFRPAWRYIAGTFRTPFIAATTIGKNEARKIRKIAAVLLTPNSTIATGIHASGLIGLRNWITGFMARAADAYQPSASPTGMPTTSASEEPAATRTSESRT